ncbi:MAG: hypothetical protein DRO67_02545 [Candidatus Asgardarchaeum californiense]|nr:MAG: hypothetical protein DRO67_02545 [Candidatus Asgardarchaeum californiense]
MTTDLFKLRDIMIGVVTKMEFEITRIPPKEAGRIVGINRYGDTTLYIDVLGEDVAISELKKHFDSFRLLTEEKGIVEIGNPHDDDPLFILDPVDGSTNYIRGIGYASISLAVAFGKPPLTLNDIVVGVVKQMFFDKTYSAIKGEGAWVNKGRAHPSQADDITKAIIDIDIIKNIPPEKRRILYPIFEKVYDIRRLGSNALSLANVADGTLDAAIDLRTKLRVFDCAAAQLIAKESGAKIKMPDYPINIDVRVNYVAAATQKLLGEILEIIPTEFLKLLENQ